jgi:hypothetical protein
VSACAHFDEKRHAMAYRVIRFSTGGAEEIDHNIAGAIATAAKAVNAIPAVCAAPPGLLSLRDLPVSRVPALLRR